MAIQPLNENNQAYLKAGTDMLADMFKGEGDIGLPELQALMKWCVDQGWSGGPEVIEEYGPVLALGVGLGLEIKARASMEWVWSDGKDDSYHGLALQLGDGGLCAYPVAMIARRVADHKLVDVAALVRDTCTNIEQLAKGSFDGPMERV